MAELASSDSTSPTLLERARNSDYEAWNKVSQLYAPRIYALARQAGLQEEDAKDLGQEVFQLLAKRLPEFNRQRTGSFRNWLFRTTQNLLREHFRRRAKFPELMGGLAEHIPSFDIDANDPDVDSDSRRAFIHRLMDTVREDFEEHTWNVFWRTTVEGDTAADVAADCGMTAKAVRQAKYRVLQRLRREFQELA